MTRPATWMGCDPMLLDGESRTRQSPRECAIVLDRPHADSASGDQCSPCALETRNPVQARVPRRGERIRSVVDVEQDRVVGAARRADQLANVAEHDADPRIVEWRACELCEWTAIPLDDLRDELADRHAGIGREHVQRRAQGESHAEPADQHAHSGSLCEPRAAEERELLLALVSAAVHQLSAAQADRELGSALGQHEVAVRHLCAPELLPPDHASDGSIWTQVDARVPMMAADPLPPTDDVRRTLGSIEGKAIPKLLAAIEACRPGDPLEDQLDGIEALGRFVIAGPPMPTVGHDALARLQLLVDLLEKVPAARARFQRTMRSVLAQTRAIKLFGEVGLPNDRGLLAETTDRLARKFLPEAPQPHELTMLASRIFRSISDLDWLGPAADPLLHRLAAVGGDCWSPLRTSIIDAISMLTTRLAALGMAEQFRTRTAVTGVRDSPLYHLARARPAEMPAIIEAARRHLDQVRVALEDRGVSIDVVYSLDSIDRGLNRIELLLPFVDPEDELEPTYEIRAVFAAVGRGLVGARSFVQLMSDNLRLLARKVIERAGKTGEHYVTSSRKEYWQMLRSAFGGGVLTVGTIVAKFVVKWQNFPLFFDGLMSSFVYAGSFVVMQLVGFTLATKQPSMTAAALAGSIRERAGPGRLDELVPLIARIARSQFAAAVGNISAVIMTALLMDLILVQTGRDNFLDPETSKGVIASFDPLGSGTIFFAALTGVLLWISSLVAGWFENWVVYRRLPEAIEHHRWGDTLGKARMKRWAHFLEHQAAGFGGSVALGFLLGMVPVFAKFFGLPLDVRHVTLSSGSLTLAINSVGVDAIGWGPVIWAMVGIAFIGLLNFGVSFALALLVALRARDVQGGERLTLPGAVLRRFLRKPFEFFYPPKDPKPVPGAPPPDPPAH